MGFRYLKRARKGIRSLSRKLSIVLSQINPIRYQKEKKKKKIQKKSVAFNKKEKKPPKVKTFDFRKPLYKGKSDILRDFLQETQIQPPHDQMNEKNDSLSELKKQILNEMERKIVVNKEEAFRNQERIRERKKESNRRKKLSYVVVLFSRLSMFEQHHLQHIEEKKKQKREKNFECLVKKLVVPLIIQRRRRRYECAMKIFQNYLIFYKLWKTVKLKKDATIKIRDFLQNFRESHMMKLMINRLLRKIDDFQQIIRTHREMEEKKVSLNFLKWVVYESKFLFHKYEETKESFLKIEDEYPKIDNLNSPLKFGSFTYIITTPEYKLRKLRNIFFCKRKKIVSSLYREMDLSENFNFYMIEDSVMDELVVNGLKMMKRKEIELRKTIFYENEFKDYKKICKELQVEYNSKVKETFYLLEGWFNKDILVRYKTLFKCLQNIINGTIKRRKKYYRNY